MCPDLSLSFRVLFTFHVGVPFSSNVHVLMSLVLWVSELCRPCIPNVFLPSEFLEFNARWIYLDCVECLWVNCGPWKGKRNTVPRIHPPATEGPTVDFTKYVNLDDGASCFEFHELHEFLHASELQSFNYVHLNRIHPPAAEGSIDDLAEYVNLDEGTSCFEFHELHEFLHFSYLWWLVRLCMSYLVLFRASEFTSFVMFLLV